MVTNLTTIYSSPDQFVQYSNGPVIRCLVPVKIDRTGIQIPTVDHPNTGLVRYYDVDCIQWLLELSDIQKKDIFFFSIGMVSEWS
jgi:hypothetical protein